MVANQGFDTKCASGQDIAKILTKRARFYNFSTFIGAFYEKSIFSLIFLAEKNDVLRKARRIGLAIRTVPLNTFYETNF